MNQGGDPNAKKTKREAPARGLLLTEKPTKGLDFLTKKWYYVDVKQTGNGGAPFMKKRICLLLIACLIATALASCGLPLADPDGSLDSTTTEGAVAPDTPVDTTTVGTSDDPDEPDGGTTTVAPDGGGSQPADSTTTTAESDGDDPADLKLQIFRKLHYRNSLINPLRQYFEKRSLGANKIKFIGKSMGAKRIFDSQQLFFNIRAEHYLCNRLREAVIITGYIRQPRRFSEAHGRAVFFCKICFIKSAKLNANV